MTHGVITLPRNRKRTCELRTSSRSILTYLLISSQEAQYTPKEGCSSVKSANFSFLSPPLNIRTYMSHERTRDWELQQHCNCRLVTASRDWKRIHDRAAVAAGAHGNLRRTERNETFYSQYALSRCVAPALSIGAKTACRVSVLLNSCLCF